MSRDDSHLDPEAETAELRDLMRSTGVSDYLEEDLDGVETESASSLIARLRAADLEGNADQSSGGLRRPAVRTLFAGAAAAVVATIVVVVQPWHTEVARAGTPPILNFEFAEADRIADSPGVDPREALQELARAADASPSGVRGRGVQHVVIEGWSIDTDFDADPNSSITPTMSENWIYPDGRFRTRSFRGEPLKADGRGIPLGGRVDRSTELTSEEDEAPGSRDAQFFTNMPATIQGVRDRLLDRVDCLDRQRGQERTLCLIDQVTNLANTYVIPPAVMARIWRMLADEEGFRSLGTVRDRAGRGSVALSFIWNGAPEYRQILLADPKTGRVVGSERILIRASPSSPVDPPAIQEFSAVVSSQYQ